MMRTQLCAYLLVASLLLGGSLRAQSSAAMLTHSPSPLDPQLAALDQAIDQGIDFLRAQYRPEFGLLQESPVIGAKRIYWTNDNLLAAHVLEVVGADDLSAQIREQLADYTADLAALGLAADRNHFIEVAWGETIPWPPYRHRDVVVKSLGEQACDFFDGDGEDQEDKDQFSPCLFYETHLGPGRHYDWSSYANLACMGAINEWTLGNSESARRLLEMKMVDFDGYGFADAVYWHDRPSIYETLGLAWCLYAAALLDAPVDQRLLDALLRQQNGQSGGFHTHYRWDAPQLADPNIETTATALLALHTLRPKLHLLVRDPAAWAVDYLHSQYNPEFGLLRESVETAQYHYWLTTDNQLAIYALRAAGETVLPDRLAASIAAYGGARHGMIESFIGDVIETWPPYVETQTIVALGSVGERCPKSDEVNAPVICRETRLAGNQYWKDWDLYSDLLLYGVLRAHQQGRSDDARALYAQALDQFNGIGFADLAAKDGKKDGAIVLYATYKLALAIYVGAQLGEPLRQDILDALLQKQAPSGGFHTLYKPDGTIAGDTNTETTSYALLALLTVARYATYLPHITH